MASAAASPGRDTKGSSGAVLWRWLHLSDIHTGCRGEAFRRQAMEAFRADIVTMTERLGAPELILLTGDMANFGKTAEFQQFDKFLDELLGWLNAAAGGLPPLVIPVPGNHDLVRPKGAAARPYSILKQFSLGDVDPDIKTLHDEVWGTAPDTTFFDPLFADYTAWRDGIIKRYLTRDRVDVHRSPFPGDLSVRIDIDGRVPLTVVGLNGAWMQCAEGDYERRMELWAEQFDAAWGEFPRTTIGERAALLLIHHPRDWFSPASRGLFDELVYPPERFVACLHGHMHEALATGQLSAGGQARTWLQAPSLFGLEHYGTARQDRRIGYAWGELRAGNEIRIWPRKYERRGDGASSFSYDSGFHGSDADGVVVRPADRPPPAPATAGATKRKSAAGTATPDPDAALDRDLATYTAWARERFAGIDLIGLGGNDLRLTLDEVYVPLRIARRHPDDHTALSAEANDVDLVAIFTAAGAGNPALILGEPGAGKTTALRKLLHVCLAPGDGPARLGLAAGTVPVFLRLRRFTPELLHDPDPLGRFIEQEVAELSEGKLPGGFGARLWQQGGLVLLFDGLDEIADETLRGRVATFLDHEVRDWDRRRVRAVVSCRRAGYDGERVRFGARFLHLDVRPLDEGQRADLVHRWFRHVSRLLDRGNLSDAMAEADRLLADLKTASYGAQQVQVLVATPLMLTLLCLVVLRGGRIPQRRVEFYAECLEVLLQRWLAAKDGTGDKRIPPLLDLTAALAVLRPLAWHLHRAGRRDDLRRNEGANLFEDRLPGQDGFAVLDWLHQRAGVLADTGPQLYGFMHLGFQEYLAAGHVAAERRLVSELAGMASDKWWREVALLVAGLADRTLFAELAEALLAGLDQPDRPDLLRQCLAEAGDADLGPFLSRLAPGGDAGVQETVLRLLIGRTDPALREAARELATSSPRWSVRELARRYVEPEASGQGKPFDLLVIGSADDAARIDGLSRRLQCRGLRVWPVNRPWLGDIRQVRSEVAAVAVVAITSSPWHEREVQDGLSLLARAGLVLVRVLPPGMAAAGDLPDPLHGTAAVAWSDRIETDLLSALDQAAGRQRPGPKAVQAAGAPAAGSVIIEPRTGLRLLRIPAGKFMMGAEDGDPNERPVHQVRLTEFWLGETSVANRHYRKFLEATKQSEPAYWRDRRFADPDQPVVGVSWHDAAAFCAWLSEGSEHRFALPSEAQWEYAARGTDGRAYPWGNEPPTPDRACYGLGVNKPAPVGSFPAGRGPFGTLDQAGTVWEWCADVWNGKAYQQWAKGTAVDPFNDQGDADWRVLRGGAWSYPPEGLRAAYRGRDRAGNRDDVIGFRVAAAPAGATGSG